MRRVQRSAAAPCAGGVTAAPCAGGVTAASPPSPRARPWRVTLQRPVAAAVGALGLGNGGQGKRWEAVKGKVGQRSWEWR